VELVYCCKFLKRHFCARQVRRGDLVAAATSLPEVSAVVAAVRMRRYLMAFSDIFGTNIFDIMLIFLIDAVYRGPPVLNEQGGFAAMGAVIAIAVTVIYAAGLIERRDKVFLRIGIDSWAVAIVYVGGVAALLLALVICTRSDADL
jgi:cation:H+ antiporter